jgi:hypothetical protein
VVGVNYLPIAAVVVEDPIGICDMLVQGMGARGSVVDEYQKY